MITHWQRESMEDPRPKTLYWLHGAAPGIRYSTDIWGDTVPTESRSEVHPEEQQQGEEDVRAEEHDDGGSSVHVGGVPD